MIRQPPRSTLFPYTPLSRSRTDRRPPMVAIALTAYASPHDRTQALAAGFDLHVAKPVDPEDRKSTRLNSSHSQISYAVFCLKKKKTTIRYGERHITTGTYKP